MDKLVVNGGKALSGKVKISGAKNAVSKFRDFASSCILLGKVKYDRRPHSNLRGRRGGAHRPRLIEVPDCLGQVLARREVHLLLVQLGDRRHDAVAERARARAPHLDNLLDLDRFLNNFLYYFDFWRTILICKLLVRK